MADLRTAAQQALEALKYMHDEKCDYMRRNNLGDPLREDAARLALPAIEALETALAQAEPVQGPFALPCPTPKACREHCCSGHCIPRATSPQHSEPVEAVQKSGEFRVMVCGVDCHPGDQHCNGYCTGKTDDPPEATAEQAEAFAATQNRERPSCDECGKSKADGWALYCVECLEKVFTAPQQAEPERNFCPRCGKRLHGDGIHTCTPPQTKCSHCASPLFAALECRVCGRKEVK